MGIDTKVDFPRLRRLPEGNVEGNVALHFYGDFDWKLGAKDFNFPRGGEQQVFDLEEKIGGGATKLSIRLTAKVYEDPQGQCCIQGHWHVTPIIGGGFGGDLQANCHLIPNA